MSDVFEITAMCAEKGWRATFHMLDGETIQNVYITGTDWENNFVSVERVGERNRPPRLISLRDVTKVDPHWG